MTPAAFVAKWKAADLKERSAAQEHFLDLCRLLDESTPAEPDPSRIIAPGRAGRRWHTCHRDNGVSTGG
jgi:hypothetical protein